MFENKDNNKKMILGAYKKLKSYYYYDKTVLFNKMSISAWEADPVSMNSRIERLADFMTTIEDSTDNKYLNLLMQSMVLVPVPKSFIEDTNEDIGVLILNSVPQKSVLNKVNFYIKLPVELLILDLIWMLMISKIAYSCDAISRSAYANKPKVSQLFVDENDDLSDGVDFSSNRLFIPYFKQYTSWRNNALIKIRNRYDSKKDSILISLDIKSYFYSVSFDFNNLPNYLNNDARLKFIEPLTKIIRRVYIEYTAEMKKYRGAIPADCQKGQCALPIGLHSSMLIANLYLKGLDDAIESKLKPEYYGRYVDDILIVTDKPSTAEVSVTSILYETLEVNGIIKPKTSGSYCLLFPDNSPNYLTLQSDKIRCIYFNHEEPDALIKLLCEASKIKPSMAEGSLMPDIGFAECSFDEQAYSIDNNVGALKVRNFLYSPNNYEAILFINNLISVSKNVDIKEAGHKNYIEKQLDQILKFYNARQAIEYRSAWINIFTLILINKRFDYLGRFYYQLRTSIDNITVKGIESIESLKTIAVLNNVKKALIEQLDIAVSISIAPFSIREVAVELDKVESHLSKEVFENAQDIRNANMFNNHFTSFPLISYICDNNDISFVAAKPSDIAPFSVGKLQLLSKENRKIDLCPRFIHFDELCLLTFLLNFKKGGNPVYGSISQICSIFSSINNLSDTIQSPESNELVGNEIRIHNIKVQSEKKNIVPKSFKIALASIHLDEETDIKPVLANPVHDLSPAKKRELYKILNEALKNHANMIVFPEYYLPIHWIEEIYTFSRKNAISIICGLRYITNKQVAYNYMAVIQPFNVGWFNYAIPLFREKNHYAPSEKIALAQNQFECFDPTDPSLHLIEWNGIKYSDLMCFELTNIEYRFLLRNRIDVLIIPELNKDTNYFSNIVESTSRDLNCFVVQSNTSKYGDSRITGPYNSLYKDIIKIKGGENNVLLIGTIDCLEVQKKRENYQHELLEKIEAAKKGKKLSEKEGRFVKDPSAGFFMRKEAQHEF